MFTLEYAKNPVWMNDEQTAIHLTVKFVEFNEELPFTAASYDTESHGIELFNRAKADEFGTIAPYVASPVTKQPKTTGTITA